MSLTPLTCTAVVGGPAAGSQIRGIPMLSAAEKGSWFRLPQAKILPFGNNVICSGTMSHCTTGPQAPVLASAGSGEMVIADEVTVADPAANWIVFEPGPRIPRSPKAASPFASVVALLVPSSVPPPDAICAVTWTPARGCP